MTGLLLLVGRAVAQVTVQSTGDIYATIGEALDNAAAGDTLLVDAGVYEEQVDLVDDIEIVGVGDVTISASGEVSRSVIEVLPLVDVVLTDLTITSPDQRGINLQGINTFTCTRCRFEGTNAFFGGGVQDPVGGSTIVLVDSTFTGTSAVVEGGAVFLDGTASFTSIRTSYCAPIANDGGAISGSADTVLLVNNRIVEPSAGDGGALFAQDGGAWTITNNHFLGSDATIFATDPGTTVALRNNLFTTFGTHNISGFASATWDYNLFDPPSSIFGASLGAGNIEGEDPLLVAYSADGDCTNDSLWPAIGSPLLDAGDPAILDPDGGPSDIGAYGGPSADPALHVDADGDGASFLHDCDDTSVWFSPFADEICDDADNDCDGTIDDDPIDIESWACDADGDGQGPAGLLPSLACDEPTAPCAGGWLSFSTAGARVSQDCNDADPDIYFGAEETCAAGDQDCDGQPDDGAIDAIVYFADADGDAFGSARTVLSCSAAPPAGTAAAAGDCDDDDDTIFPSANDPCGDAVDQDCDGIDGVLAYASAWYADTDGDGYGAPSPAPLYACADLSGAGFTSAEDAADCDDADPDIHPDAPEICNLLDDDCNAAIDDVGTVTTWFPDADGDGFGDDRFPVDDDCPPDPTYVAGAGDCDDADPAVAALVPAWPDWDGDGYGACAVFPCEGTPTCPSQIAAGEAPNDDDCHDGNALVHPGATEIAGNDIDEDCNGIAEDPPDFVTAAPQSGCGCASGPSPSSGALVLVLVLLAVTARAGSPIVPAFLSYGPVDEDTSLVVAPPGLLDLASDSDGDPLTALLAAAPSFGALVLHADGSFVYTADADWSGTDSFTWSASDGVNRSADGTVFVDVDPVNDPPVASPDGVLVTVEDTPLAVDPLVLLANDTDEDDDPASLVAVPDLAAPPAHGCFVLVSGVLLYTPDSNWSGTDTLSYAAVDPAGAKSASTPITVDVLAVNDAPLAADDAYGEVTPGVPATGNVLTNDSDPEGEPLTAELVVPPLGGMVAFSADGAFTYTPAEGFVGGDAFTYVARDVPLLASAPAVASFFVLPAAAPSDTGDTGCTPSPWFLDADGDGYGDDATFVEDCVAPPGHVAKGGDCNDSVRDVNPDADEIPVSDGVDQDCDGLDNHFRPVGACTTGPPVLSALLVLLSLLSTRMARASPCAEDTPAQVDEALDSVWTAYVGVDEPAFDRASKSLTAAIACLDREPAPGQIARLHQGMAIVSFVAGQTRAARKSLAAARVLDPGWKLPEDPFAEGHPYRELYDAAVDPGPVAPIGRAPDTVWIVDGVERDDAPIQRAMLLQISDGASVIWSGYLWSFDEIPDRGQAPARGPTPPIYALDASLQLFGTYGTSHQEEADAGAGATGGLSLAARYTPLAFLGVEVEAEAAGAPLLPAGHAVLLVGGSGRSSTRQLHAAVRLGGALERVALWDSWTVGSLMAGLEGGVRTPVWRAALAADLLAAGAREPSEIRVHMDVGRLFGNGPFAFEGTILWRSVTRVYEDIDGFVAGSRTDGDLRVGLGVAAWL